MLTCFLGAFFKHF